MKTTITTYALFFFMSYAGAQNFSIEKTDAGDEITFRVAKEINVTYYLIEGTDDNINFDILCRMNAMGIGSGPVKYDYINYGQGYLHYIVRQIDMSGSCVSQIGNTPETANLSNLRCHIN